jgi:hypothetical protein
LGDASVGQCECSGQHNSAVCSASAATADMCSVCCLNAGYLASMWSALGSPECNCRAP